MIVEVEFKSYNMFDYGVRSITIENAHNWKVGEINTIIYHTDNTCERTTVIPSRDLIRFEVYKHSD